jgi:hypothetical protein
MYLVLAIKNCLFGINKQYFSYIMATSFSGGRSWSTRREPPTMGKQLVNFITCGCKSNAPFLARCLGRLSFLSESISQKLSTVSIWNVEYLFTIKRGTNYNKADDPVICISRVICPCFDIVHRNWGYFLV